MPGFSQFAGAKRPLVSWQGALICLAILCLNAHLARRFHLPLSGTATVQSNSAKVQHMDSDAHRWIPPVRTAPVSLVRVLTPLLLTEVRSYQSLSVPCLYDRPPPTAL
jgi:hypothetical protein